MAELTVNSLRAFMYVLIKSLINIILPTSRKKNFSFPVHYQSTLKQHIERRDMFHIQLSLQNEWYENDYPFCLDRKWLLSCLPTRHSEHYEVLRKHQLNEHFPSISHPFLLSEKVSMMNTKWSKIFNYYLLFVMFFFCSFLSLWMRWEKRFSFGALMIFYE